MNKAIRFIFVFLLLIAAPAIWADESYRVFRSGYFLGRGDTGIATADNHEALFYNPAGLALGDGIYKETVLISPHIEMSKNTKDLIRQVAVEKNSDPKTLAKQEGKNQHLGLYNFSGIVLRRAALGAVVSNQTNILVYKSPEQASLTEVRADTVANRLLTFGVADSFFNDQLLIGATYKYLARDQAGITIGLVDAQEVAENLESDELMNSATGSGADIGLMYRITKGLPMSFGLTVENAGNMVLKGNTAADDNVTLKQTINLGLAIEPQTRFSRLSLLADYRDVLGAVEPNVFKRTHLGAEIAVRRFTGVTAGLNQGYPTIGIFLNLYIIRLDLGAYGEEMGERVGNHADVRYYFRLAAGF